jgi:16S rRNA (adenine1518-N6/adenine1519-N6)-dimethyltransferase
LLATADIPPGRAYKVVANLPYYITSVVLRHFLEGDARPRVMVVMVQKEVARAITAAPGEMSLLSVAVQFYGEARIVSSVSARSFFPVPKVDSAILKIRLHLRPLIDADKTDSFFELVRAGFCANRKQLINSLSQGLSKPKDEIRALLDKAAIEPKRRAETLTVAEWVKLWRVFDAEAEPC